MSRAPANHRTRVGIERRGKTRTRLTGAEMIASVGAVSQASALPAVRFAAGLKAFADLMQRHPLTLGSIGHLGIRSVGSGRLFSGYCQSDPGAVIAPAVADTLSPKLAADLIEASTKAMVLRLKSGAVADEAAFLLPDIPSNSLIMRSENARREAARSSAGTETPAS